MSILYRGPSNDGSYQVSIHLAMPFQRRRIFRNQPPQASLVSYWLISKTAFPLKPLSQMI
jgi:hypothetical protein